jgi:hypothetical protein
MIAKINDRCRENYRTKTLTKRNYLKIFVGGFRKKLNCHQAVKWKFEIGEMTTLPCFR